MPASQRREEKNKERAKRRVLCCLHDQSKAGCHFSEARQQMFGRRESDVMV
jgi:hypothetical protein